MAGPVFLCPVRTSEARHGKIRNRGPLTVVNMCSWRSTDAKYLTLMVLASSSRPSFLSIKNSCTSLRWSPCNWITSPISVSLTIVPLQANFFLMTLRIFFWSNFLGSPWTVVNVLRPLRSGKGVSSRQCDKSCLFDAYVGYGYECSSATACSLLYLHRLRRRGL